METYEHGKHRSNKKHSRQIAAVDPLTYIGIEAEKKEIEIVRLFKIIINSAFKQEV